MRGRLLRPFLAEICRLSTTATAADPDGAGTLTSGYDPVWRETRLLPNSSGTGTDARQELSAVRIKAQVESGTGEWLALQQLAAGNVPRTQLVLCVHFRDLEIAGLVQASTGLALLRAGDRLAGIYDLKGNLVQSVPTPPGLYVTEARPASLGLGVHRNLLLVTFEPRDQGRP